MDFHNNSLCYAFPYQNMQFYITQILKEIIAQILLTPALPCDSLNIILKNKNAFQRLKPKQACFSNVISSTKLNN